MEGGFKVAWRKNAAQQELSQEVLKEDQRKMRRSAQLGTCGIGVTLPGQLAHSARGTMGRFLHDPPEQRRLPRLKADIHAIAGS